MTHSSVDVEEILFRPLSDKWRGLAERAFCRKFRADVCELHEAEVVRTHNLRLDTHGLSEIFVLSNGLAVLCSEAGRYSLFETLARAQERDNLRDWANFARGYWSDRVPQESGRYFTRDVNGIERGIHELVRRNGKLVDLNSGFVGGGKATEWRGQWFYPRVPKLPGT